MSSAAFCASDPSAASMSVPAEGVATAHPNGNIFFSTQAALDAKIREILPDYHVLIRRASDGRQAPPGPLSGLGQTKICGGATKRSAAPFRAAAERRGWFAEVR